MSKQTLFYGAFFILSIILWQWLDASLQPQQNQPALVDKPNIMVNDIYSITFDETGRVNYRVRANSMNYYSARDESELTKPFILIYPDPKQPIWQIQAEHAKVQQQQSVELEEQVIVMNLSRGEYVKDIHTDWLEIDLNTESIYTDRPVRIFGQSYQLQGLGLFGNLAKETVTLLDDVDAVYYPQP